jgi:hypothetical protein
MLRCARETPGVRPLMLVFIKCQRVGPHLGAIGVEHQRWIFRRRDPGPAGELIVKLLWRPAGIAERDQALFWPMPNPDIAQHLGGIAQGHVAIDVERVRPVILGAVKGKGDIRADRPAEKYQHCRSRPQRRRRAPQARWQWAAALSAG